MDGAELERRLEEAECHVERGEQNIPISAPSFKRSNGVGTTQELRRCSSGDLRALRSNTLSNGVDCSRNWPTTPNRSEVMGEVVVTDLR
jgi:hypothetical protein